MDRGELIINYYADDKFPPWYVQRVALLDMGRFTTREAAEEHKKFLEEKEKE